MVLSVAQLGLAIPLLVLPCSRQAMHHKAAMLRIRMYLHTGTAAKRLTVC